MEYLHVHELWRHWLDQFVHRGCWLWIVEKCLWLLSTCDPFISSFENYTTSRSARALHRVKQKLERYSVSFVLTILLPCAFIDENGHIFSYSWRAWLKRNGSWASKLSFRKTLSLHKFLLKSINPTKKTRFVATDFFRSYILTPRNSYRHNGIGGYFLESLIFVNLWSAELEHILK
jgi:hypothetical protein